MQPDKFGDQTTNEILRQIKRLFQIHGSELNAAYIKHADMKFAISFKAIIETAGASNSVKTTISYQTEPPVKDTEEGLADENQIPLFDKPEIKIEQPQ